MFYKFQLSNGVKKLVQLRNVNFVELNKNKITLYFNSPLVSGSHLFGSGSMDSQLHSEWITWEKESDAQREFERLEAFAA